MVNIDELRHAASDEATDSELTKAVLDILGWTVYEYPDSVPDRDEDGSILDAEISLFGIKTAEGVISQRGFLSEEEVYSFMNVFSYAFMYFLIDFIHQKNWSMQIHVPANRNASVLITPYDISNDKNFMVSQQLDQSEDSVSYMGIPKLLCKALVKAILESQTKEEA